MAKKNVQLVMDLAAKFIGKSKGNWDHEQWEKLVKEAGKEGLPMDAEGQRNLGLILEAGKFFLQCSPKETAPKKSKDKHKEKDKDKVKEKKAPKPKITAEVKTPDSAPPKPVPVKPMPLKPAPEPMQGA